MTNRCNFPPLQIAEIPIPNPLSLAPMAGVSDLPYRRLCHQMGAGLVYTELVSARGLRYSKSIDPSFRYIDFADDPGLTAVQLFGSEPDDFRAALEILLTDPRSRNLRILDINMGCPVPKVVKSGSGAALLLDPTRAAEIVRKLKADLKPLGIACTVKTRIGFHAGQNIAADFVKTLAEAGADAIALHGRTRAQMYSGQADVGAIAAARKALGDPDQGGVPLIANGDITDGPSALNMLQQTGAAGLMIGRAARGNPWIFHQIEHYLKTGETETPPTAAEIARIGRAHCKDCLASLDEDIACRELRKTLAWYTHGLHGAAALRRLATQINTAEDIEWFWQAVESSPKTA